MAEKDTQLSITIRAVDRATAVIRALNAKIAAIAKPTMGVFKDIGTAIGAVLSRIGSVIGGVLDKIPLVGGLVAGAVGGAVAAVVHLVDKFDDLGKAAERVGVGVDFLADLRYAAEKTGAPIESLDEGLQSFSQNLGAARAGTGRMLKFLNLVSPALAQQLKAAKSNEAAFLLLADAMAKLQDPAKRAALAQKTVGDAALAPLLARGAAGIKKLATEHEDLAGSMKGAVAASEEAHASMVELHAAIDGAEAAIVVGMAPALKIIVEQLSEWFVAHRSDIAEWAKTIGEKIPGAFKAIVGWVGNAIEKLGKFFGLLEDIYDKVKEITHANDAEYQANIAADTVPMAQKAAAAKSTAASGEVLSGAHDSMLSAFGGFFGLGALADTDVGRQATGKVLALAGVNEQLQNNIFITGEYQRVLAEKLREQAAGAVQLRPGPPLAADSAGAPPAQAKITVDFANAPRGMRAQIVPGNTAEVDLNVGHQMNPGTP